MDKKRGKKRNDLVSGAGRPSHRHPERTRQWHQLGRDKVTGETETQSERERQRE